MGPCMPLVDYSSSDSNGHSDGAPSPKRPKVVPPSLTSNGDGGNGETRPKPTPETEPKAQLDAQSKLKPSLPKPKPAPKPKPKRALPTLPSSFAAAADTPHLHQGRRRARPFVDGDYYAHVYVELPVSRRLARVIGDMVAVAGKGVHPILDREGERVSSASASTASSSASPGPSSSSPTPPSPRCLHVSLSHPLPLRRGHLSSFPTDIAAALRPRPDSTAASRASISASTPGTPFRLSLTPHPVTYRNAPGAAGLPGGRAFLALRVGAGARELARMLERVHGVLGRYHLPLYHADAEFHASMAWALCEGSSGGMDKVGGEGGDGVGAQEQEGEASMGGRDGGRELEDPAGQEASGLLEPFPPDLVAELGRRFEAGLLAEQPRGGWEVSAVCVKVGKVVTRIPL